MGRYPDTAAPEHLDYDRWLGPAPKRAYNPNRCHLLFRWFFDYAGGMMSDWGVHLNDIVLWALDSKGPQAVTTTGGIFTSDDNRDTPDTMQVVYEFPGCTLTYSMRKGNGLKFNRFHTTALCSPTRQAMLTGRNHHSVNMGGICEIATSAPGYSSVLPKNKAPLAMALKLNGYSTAQFGKCHNWLGLERPPTGRC